MGDQLVGYSTSTPCEEYKPKLNLNIRAVENGYIAEIHHKGYKSFIAKDIAELKEIIEFALK